MQLVSKQVTLEDLAEDSLISIEGLNLYYQNAQLSDSIFVYKKNIPINKIEVGNQLEIEPIQTSFNQSIDEIKVTPISKVQFSRKIVKDPISIKAPFAKRSRARVHHHAICVFVVFFSNFLCFFAIFLPLFFLFPYAF